MLIKVGCEIVLHFPQPTATILMLYLHPSVAPRVRHAERVELEPWAAIARYTDLYGNTCGRTVVPAGRVAFRHHAIVYDEGHPEPQEWTARQHPVEDLPDSSLIYLLGSRYCEVDSELKDIAWSLFSTMTPGWPLVQAICDFVHRHIHFDYQQARPNRTALEVYRERTGVCRDFMHLAITFCRCLNIPARYCTGYISDVNMPPPYGPMDFAAWFEVYLEGGWYMFDARNNKPMYGRVLMARGRDAADVAMITSFGPNELRNFTVICDELPISA